MISNEFDFTLHKSLWERPEDENLVFHAKAWCENAYHVTFLEEGEEKCVGYWKESVEKYVNEGIWIILNK